MVKTVAVDLHLIVDSNRSATLTVLPLPDALPPLLPRFLTFSARLKQIKQQGKEKRKSDTIEIQIYSLLSISTSSSS
jgi:hypothetical protein